MTRKNKDLKATPGLSSDHTPRVRTSGKIDKQVLASIKRLIPDAVVTDRKVSIPQNIVVPLVKNSKGKWMPRAGAKIRVLGAKAPVPQSPPEGSTSYDSMSNYYREYRTNPLIRSCINLKSMLATNKGFKPKVYFVDEEENKDKTKLENLQKQKSELLAYINTANKNINADFAWRIASTWMQVEGRYGAEIVWKVDKKFGKRMPQYLIPIDSAVLFPEYNESWKRESYKYDNKEGFFKPKDLLYFSYNSLDRFDYGLSDIEAILTQAQTYRMILEETIPEAITVAWSGMLIHNIDTSDLDDDDADTKMEEYILQLKPAKHVIVNQKVEITPVALNPQLEGIKAIKVDLERNITGALYTPPALVGEESKGDRATVFAQIENFINGPIIAKQQQLKRQIEVNWYDRLHMEFEEVPDLIEEDIRVKHEWNPIRVFDFNETARSCAQLFGTGAIARSTVYQLLGLKLEEVDKDELALADTRRSNFNQNLPADSEKGVEPIRDSQLNEARAALSEDTDYRKSKIDLVKSLLKRVNG